MLRQRPRSDMAKLLQHGVPVIVRQVASRDRLEQVQLDVSFAISGLYSVKRQDKLPLSNDPHIFRFMDVRWDGRTSGV